MTKLKTYTDTIHDFVAKAPSKPLAWALIRNKCHKLNLDIPMISEIRELKMKEKERGLTVETGFVYKIGGD